MSDSVDLKDEKNSPRVQFGCAFAASQIDLLLFHPGDTIDKRLQKSSKKIFNNGTSLATKYRDFKKIAFKDAANKGILEKGASVYSGLGAATLGKGPQKALRFGGQPLIHQQLENTIGPQIKRHLGEKNGNIFLETIAGAAIGGAEGGLLPLDKIKVIGQLNDKPLGLVGIKQAITNDPYVALGPTLARNMIGNSALFLGSAFAKEYLLKIQQGQKPTFMQNLEASTFGAIIAVPLTNGPDVLKTRMQSNNCKLSSMQMAAEMLKKEGASAFFKGTGTRMVTAVPRLAVLMTLSQTLPTIYKSAVNFFSKPGTPKEKSSSTMNLTAARAHI